MIYFSDLDRTLIYSSKFLKDKNNKICIEYLNGKEINYISKNTINLLKKIQEKTSCDTLHPTPTRIRSQMSPGDDVPSVV